ncbi:iron complex transport system substrate-binding protein [Marivirga sericea]|uniref:Iron complex transport system substrate-binding protein n=1 Tax=Marivirga sericea TaxID=1028 RepID=A0A1X7LAT1_9BACT|nr:ABC transporter substrate-binding protein [Marivirga sericea]SMG50865.1 iron complex transport system substrate-binding protein [Marivirga sericea]
MRPSFNLFIIPILFLACSQPKRVDETEIGKPLIQYSKKLSIDEFENYYKVRVLNSSSTDSSFFTYILHPNEKPKVEGDAYIQIPIKKAVCLSTSHLPPFTILNKSALAGFPNTNLIFNKELLQLVDVGKIQDVGRKNGVNVEKTMTIQPDVVMAFSMGSSMEQLKPLQKAGIPIILNVDYLENSPLGRTEWLKLTAVLLNQYHAGDSLFRTIEAAYNKIKSSVAKIADQPSVLAGMMYGDIWYVPGGESFAAHFIKDAGGDYLWSENSESGSLELSFESVLSTAQNAKYWIGAASFTSLKDLENSNNKYTLFDAFQHQKVYSYTKRVNQNGANDYLESGFLRADLVLKDYVNLLHPRLLDDSTTTYFEVLNP